MQQQKIAWLLTLIVLGTGGIGAHNAYADPLACSSSLSGDQEVPPVLTEATGSAILHLNDEMTELSIVIEIEGIDLEENVTGAHIHNASAGSNGPVVFGFISPNNDLDGDLTLDNGTNVISSAWDSDEGNGVTLTEMLDDLQKGNLYINVHTPTVPSGEIRGQISCVPIVDVGGDLWPIDNTALFLAGLSQSMVWMIPTLAGIAGAGIIIRTKLHRG